MSEYQYYEFQALDRPLTVEEQRKLRTFSSRATITASRFVNHYEWGSFRGNPSGWMEEYFDAFLYVANWGTHQLSIRLPGKVLDLETTKRYCGGRAASARSKDGFVILDFSSEAEWGNDWDEEWDDGTGWLSSLIPLRTDLAGGDHRALYLAWLLCVQARELEDDATEPPVPPGLGDLTAPLQAFADFLRIDQDLVAAAAARSLAEKASSPTQEVERWIAGLPDAVKTGWLVRLAGGTEPHLRAELLRSFRESRPGRPGDGGAPRTVGKLLAAAERISQERRRKEAEKAAREQARREREAAEARSRYLATLAGREAKLWSKVDELIATKNPGRYDDAVKLLCDLRELALQQGRADEIEARLLRLREEHAKKWTFLERLKKAGLG